MGGLAQVQALLMMFAGYGVQYTPRLLVGCAGIGYRSRRASGRWPVGLVRVGSGRARPPQCGLSHPPPR